MPSTFRIPKATVTGLYGKALSVYARRTYGQVPDNAYVLWHHRKVLKAVLGFEQKVAKWDRLDPNLKSYAQLAGAGVIGCSWCLDFGYFTAHNDGLDLTKIREVPRWRGSDVFTSLERDVLEYAEAMSTTPLGVTDEMVTGLIEELGVEAVVELTQMVALENMRSRSTRPSVSRARATPMSASSRSPYPDRRPEPREAATPRRGGRPHPVTAANRRPGSS